MIHHIKHATRHLIFWSLIASAISLTAVRLLLLGINNYKADLSVRVSELVGAPVTIGHLRANMRGYSPELVLKDIKILSTVPKLQLGNEKPAIQLKEIRLGINLLDVLVSRDLFASAWVTLVGAKLAVKRKQDGSIAIVGLKASDEQPLWLLQGRKYEVLQSEVTWHDEKKNGRPLKFEGVDLAIINNDQQHQLNIFMRLPKKFGDTLTVSMNLTGNVFKPSALDGSIFIDGKNLNLAEWITVDLPASMNIHSGIGEVKVWSELQQSQLVSLVGDVQLQQLQLTRPEKGMFPVKQLKTRFFWELNDSQWRLDVPQFLLETPDKKWPAAVFSVSGDQGKDNLVHKLGLFVEQADLQEASSLLQFCAPLPDEQSKLLAQAQLKGSLEQFSLFADLDEKHFAVNGKFTKINVAPSSAMPGIENLTGQLKGSDQQGRVDLATKDARMTTSGLFREALKITKLKGTIAWQQTPDDWIVSSPIIELDTPDLKTKSRLSLSIPKTEGQQTFMDLQTAFAVDDVSKAARYLPASTMKKSVVDWLDHAFISGRVPKGNLLFYGNLSDFPFTGGQGVFETRFEIDRLALAYNSDWPALTDLGGEVLFLQGGLQVDLHKGLSNKVKINQAKVTIPALGESEHLLVQGKLETGILQGLEFLQQTPLNSPVNKFLDAVEPYGNTQVTLDLKLPLADGATAKVNGSAHLSNARLRVKALDLGVTQIKGALKFNEQGVYSDTIKAAAFGQPIQINIKSSDIQTTVNVAGRTGVSDLQKQFKIPEWQIAEGAADYQLKLQLPYSDSSPELVVQSKLTGVALDLPGSLAKTREQQRPFLLTFSLADEALLPINLNYDNQLKAAIKFNTKQQRVESGNVLVGTGNVAQPQKAGITLEINRDRLALQDWLGLASLAQGEKSETKTEAIDSLREIKIHSKHGLWKKTDLGFIDLALKPEGNYWAGDINSSIAMGKLKIPVDLNRANSISLAMDVLDLTVLKQLKFQDDALKPAQVSDVMPLITITSQKTLWQSVDLNGADSISMTMDVLELAALKQLNSQNEVLESSPVPDVMPLITISSQKTLWQSVDLGQLNVETERIPNGIAFKRFELAGNDQKLVLSGNWKVNGKKSETQIHGNLNMPRAGQFLSKLGITKDLTETSAVVDFTGVWNAAPYQFSLADLQGQIDVNFKGGRILSVEPGFGRILGILAMAQWIKRFQLDFSDVFEEGLTFIGIKGHFDLLNGKATTNNLVVDAIPAKITLTGNTDLINQTVDYVVNVVPKSADAVPIAGTIMGKVAALIGRTLTGKDQEGFFFGSQYLVKGVWRDAQIIPLHENDGLLQKTWNGITSFPWLQQPKNQ